MKKRWLLPILLCLGLFSAQGQFTIHGKISDSVSGTPLMGAHVLIKKTFIGTSSDMNGEFKLLNLSSGSYLLTVSFLGYSDYEKVINLRSDTLLDIELVRTAFLQDEVIIRSTRINQDMPGTYQDIPKETIQRLNIGKDIPFLLSSTPALTTTSDAGNDIGYSALRIRGTDITRINVTINGIPFNDAESHSVYWVDLPDLASSLDNIQIQRGVGTSTNGASAFGASINLQTQKLESEPYALIENSYGSFNSMKNKIALGSGLIHDNFTVDARLSHIHSDGYIDRASSKLLSYFVSGAYYSQRTLLRFNVFSGDERTYHAWEGVPGDSLRTNRTYNPAGEYVDDDGNIRYYDDQIDKYKQDHYQFLFSQEVTRHLIINGATFHVAGKGYYETYKTDQKIEDYGEDLIVGDTGVTRTDLVRQKWLDNRFSGFTLSLLYNPYKKYMITAGGAYNHYNGDHFGYVTWARNAIIPDKSKRWYENSGGKSDYHFFIKGEYFIGKTLRVYGDLQYRGISQNAEGVQDNLNPVNLDLEFHFFNPKFGLHYTIGSRHSIYGMMGLANREPTRRNYLDADPGKEPTYETLYDYEIGYAFKARNTALNLNGYFMDYHNQLVLTGEINNVGDPIMVNVPSSYRAGIEVDGSLHFLKKITWNANLTLSRNKIMGFTAYVDNWDTWAQDSIYLGTTDISFSPSIVFNSTFTYEPVSDLRINFISKYVSKQYIDNTSSDERILDPYFVNHLQITYVIRTSVIPEIGIDLMVNNLFNARYETDAWVYRYFYEGEDLVMNGFFPQATITFMAGLRFKF